LQQRFGLSYLFIAHDLAVVKHISLPTAIVRAGAANGKLAERLVAFEQAKQRRKLAYDSAVDNLNA
jgi:ABC-type glutathione transport system ATPase component